MKVYLIRPGAATVAKSLDGVAVETEVTGEVRAVPPTAKPGGPGGPGGGSGETDPTKRFTRPVPIGVSAGNLNDLQYLYPFCTAGTLGARLKGSNNQYYALSNNHVFAVQNLAQLGDPIVQPGQADNGCRSTTADQIGTLADYVPLKFGRSVDEPGRRGRGRGDHLDGRRQDARERLRQPELEHRNGDPQDAGPEVRPHHGAHSWGGDRSRRDNQGALRQGQSATFVHQIGSLGTAMRSVIGRLGIAHRHRQFGGQSGRAPVRRLSSTTIANPIGAVLAELGQKLGTTLSIQ